ncbi:MAG: glycosyltransferase [Alloprevotella sp.]|nr:glycosyltransferase [Alloprevotella sp.]
MKILHINTSELTGGAAIAAHRLMEAQNAIGLQAEMLVRDAETSDAHVHALTAQRRMWLKFVGERLDIVLRNRSRANLWQIDTGFFGADLTRTALFADTDILHLHWINQGMLSLRGLERILRSGKPVVWTLHDMWPVTGICHHADGCRKFESACHTCPLLHRRGLHDLASQVFARKQEIYREGRLALVACSDWLAGEARASALSKGLRVESITNPIDTTYFTPADKVAARRELGLPQDMPLLLFVAQKVTNPAKGFQFLAEAIDRLIASGAFTRETIGVVPVGMESEQAAQMLSCKSFPQPYSSDLSRTRSLYRAADLLVMPTLMDNLPNTIAEASACGLPTIGFRIGGLPQMIDDGRTGYLCSYCSAEHLASLIQQALTSDRRDEMGRFARQKAEEMFAQERVAQRYQALYESLLNPVSK